MRLFPRIVRTAAPVALLALLVAASTASAHVSVSPRQAPPDTNQTFTVRVPNEKPEPTVRVRVELPSGLTVSRFQPVPDWARQVEQDSQQRITSVTWSGGQIGDGEFQDFAFIARTPKENGTLTFRAFQTYQGGETVEWVNPEGQERPAPLITVGPAAAGATGTAAAGSIEGRDAAGAAATPAISAPAQAAGAAAAGGSDLPLFASLAAGALAVLAVILAGVALARRPRAVA